jgi:hypothetical protein
MTGRIGNLTAFGIKCEGFLTCRRADHDLENASGCGRKIRHVTGWNERADHKREKQHMGNPLPNRTAPADKPAHAAVTPSNPAF